MQISVVDEMAGADPAVARSVYAAIPRRKTLLEIDGGHFGLLHHPSRWFDDASSAQRAFLLRVLRPARTHTTSPPERGKEHGDS